jgi:nitrite reductase/ring-hydroxylating ferredoxin subunit
MKVAADTELGEGGTAKFSFKDSSGDDKQGFVIRHKGRLFAYINECRHIPMTMDWVDNRFLSRDGCYIQCATHGALYQIDSGHCIDGPPAGKKLHSLPVSISDGYIIVSIP